MIGFASAIVTDGSGLNAQDLFGTVGANNGSWSAFDAFLTDSAGNSVFSAVGSDLNESAYESLLVGGASPSNGLFFNTSGSGLVGLYSPTTIQPGSSGSHLDDQNPALNGSLMEATTASGPSIRTFSTIELNILQDIGYASIQQIDVVPEPKHAVLLFGAVALIGVVIVSRKRKSETS